MKKVSIVIPIYNVEEYINKCLDSVCNQTLKDIEIICVNDCSPDNCQQILLEYAEKDSRIKIIKREKNGGLSAARNNGLKEARGEYVYFLDSDDWIDADYIECMYNAAQESNVEIVVNTNIVAEYDNYSQIFSWHNYQKAPVSGEYLDKAASIGVTPCMTPVHLYRKSFLDEYKLRFPEGYIHEDNYFQFVSEVWVDKIFAFHGVAYHYRQRSNSIMSARKNKIIPYLRIMDLIYDYYCENNLVNKFDIKICDPKVFSHIDGEESFIACKGMLKKMSEYFEIKQVLFDEFDKFIISVFSDTINYEEYKKKYNTDLRLCFLKSKLRKDVKHA